MLDRKNKYLLLSLLMLLGLYPILELTALILSSGISYFPEMKWQLITEVVMMWILYAAVIPVFLGFTRRQSITARPNPGCNQRVADLASSREGSQDCIPVRFVQ